MSTDRTTILSLTLAFLVVASAVPVGDLGFVEPAAANDHGDNATYTLRQPGTGTCYEVQAFPHDHEKMVPEVEKRGSIPEDKGDVTGSFRDPDWNGFETIESIMDYRYRTSDGHGQTQYYAPYLNIQYRWEPWEYGTYGLYNWSDNGDSHLWFYQNARGEVSLVVRHDKLYEDTAISSHRPYNGMYGNESNDGFFEYAPGDGRVTWEFDDLPPGEWAYIDDMYPEGLDDYYYDGDGTRYGHREAEYEAEDLRNFTGGFFHIEWVWNSVTTNETVQHGTDGGAYRGFHNLAPGESVTITNSFTGDLDEWEVRDNDGSRNGVQRDLVMGEPLVIERGASCPEIPDVSLDMQSDAPTEVGETVEFVAETDASDAVYRWDLDGDGNYDDDTTAGPRVSHTFAAADDRTVGVQMATERGYTSEASLEVDVVESRPPTARLDVLPGDAGLDAYHVVGEQLTFDATGSTDEGGLSNEVYWSFGDGTNVTDDGQVTHSFAQNGTYTVSVTVTDRAGNTDTVNRTVEIDEPDEQSPTVRAAVTPSAVETGAPLTFDASASDDNRRITEYRWYFDGNTDGDPDVTTGNATVEGTPYESPGNYTAALEVVDGAGNSNVTRVNLSVFGREAPNLTDVSVPSRVTVDQSLSLSATATDEGRIAEYRWLVDGEVVATESETTHDFTGDVSEVQEHVVQVVVVDAAGERTTSNETTVAVLPPDERPPNASLSVEPNTTEVGESVTFNASEATDPPPHRAIARYHWDFDGNGTVDRVTTDPVVDHSYGQTGTFRAAVTVEDASGNNDTAAVNVTVEEQERAFRGGGGRGGGGGSVNFGPPPVSTETEQVAPNVTAVDVRNARGDEAIRADLFESAATADAGVQFRSLAVNLAADDSHVAFRAAASVDAPEGVPALGAGDADGSSAAPNRTLAYLDLGADYREAGVENATVEFTVGPSALTEYPAPSDVVAYHYDGEWTRLNATVVEASEDAYRLSVTADDLGTLAVGASRGLAVTDVSLGNDTVRPGQRVAATATVENAGPTARTLTLDFTLSGDVVDSATVEVPAGEVRRVTLAGSAPTPGTYEAALAGDSAGTLTVERLDPANLSVTDVSLNRSTIAAGESVAITATVENTGDRPGERAVNLTMFGEQVASETVEVAAGETQRVTFVREVAAAGTYELNVSGRTATLDVTESDDGTDSDDDTDDPGPTGTGVPGFGAAAAVVALVAAALLARLRA